MKFSFATFIEHFAPLTIIKGIQVSQVRMHLIYTSIYAGFKVRFKAESRLSLNRPYHLCEIYHKISVRFKS